MKRISAIFLIIFLLSYSTIDAQIELITNGSFETGDSTGWSISTINGMDLGPNTCVENWKVDSTSVNTCGFVSQITPTQGTYAAYTSFDSNTSNTEWLLDQKITLPNIKIDSANFSFDFKFKVNFTIGRAPTVPRELTVDLLNSNGFFIANIFQDSFFSQDSLDINYSQNLVISNLLSGRQNTDVILRFSAIIPEVSTGPSKALVDNVSLQAFTCSDTTTQIIEEACDSYVSPSGRYVWSATGNYSDTLKRVSGCDSILSIDLTITKIDTSVIQLREQLVVIADDVKYQWLDCNNGFAVLPNDTSRSFFPSKSGSYAVELKKNNCADTSACYVTSVGINENTFKQQLNIYPNPTSDLISISLPKKFSTIDVTVKNINGQIVHRKVERSKQFLSLQLKDLSQGIYFVELITDSSESAYIKIVKKN